MEILNVLVLRGPNFWAYSPVIEAWVDLREWKDSPSDSIPGFNERLMSWLPGMIEHRCSIGERGGFFERLRRGTYFAHILEHVTLELMDLAGAPVGYGRARETSKEGVYKVVFKYKDETLGQEALEAARTLVLAAALDQPFDVEATVARLREIARNNLLSPSAEALVQAARSRNIPFLRLDNKDLVQLGQGVKQRRIRGAETDRTGAIAGSIASDPALVVELLQAAGIPAGSRREHAEGTEYRLLVVDGRMVAACDDKDAKDVTDFVHTDVALRAVEAAQAVGLNIAGIDVVARNIRQPLESQDGHIVQIHPAPDLIRHLEPSEGQARDVTGAILDSLFPPGENGRIPIAAVTGTNGKTTVTRLLAHIMLGTGRATALTCTDGVYFNGHRIITGDCSGPISARLMLMNPDVEVGVFETARGGMLRGGIAFNECQVAVVTNIGEGDHLGIGYLDSPEQLAKLKRTVVEVVSQQGTAVLNAADPLVAEMAQHCPGKVLFFALDEEQPVLAAHRAAGGAAIFVRDNSVILSLGGQVELSIGLDRIPMTFGGAIRFEVENAMAAIGAAWAMGVPKDILVARVAGFTADLDHSPTRFNVFSVRGATVIVDFGHNVDSLRAVTTALESFPHQRRAALFSASGDRRDEDIRRMGELLGAAFDRVILYEDTDLYGRPPGAITALLKEGIAASRRVQRIEEIQGGLNAMRHALETVEPGELLLAQAHLADPTVDFLKSYL